MINLHYIGHQNVTRIH